jgi:hypothetical protein
MTNSSSVLDICLSTGSATQNTLKHSQLMMNQALITQ